MTVAVKVTVPKFIWDRSIYEEINANNEGDKVPEKTNNSNKESKTPIKKQGTTEKLHDASSEARATQIKPERKSSKKLITKSESVIQEENIAAEIKKITDDALNFEKSRTEELEEEKEYNENAVKQLSTISDDIEKVHAEELESVNNENIMRDNQASLLAKLKTLEETLGTQIGQLERFLKVVNYDNVLLKDETKKSLQEAERQLDNGTVIAFADFEQLLKRYVAAYQQQQENVRRMEELEKLYNEVFGKK